MEYPALLSTVGCEGVVGFIPRVKARVFSSLFIIQKRAEHLQRESEKAQELESLLDYEEPVYLSLSEEISRVVAPYEGRSDVVVRYTVDDVTVKVNPKFDVALEELLENAITHHGAPGSVEVSISSKVEDDRVVLTVEDNGQGIPLEEIAVLDAREETTLLHSSGIGLWLVDMIVTRGGGEVEIESGEEGSRVEMRLLRAETDGDES